MRRISYQWQQKNTIKIGVKVSYSMEKTGAKMSCYLEAYDRTFIGAIVKICIFFCTTASDTILGGDSSSIAVVAEEGGEKSEAIVG